jgi:hypothetical protein
MKKVWMIVALGLMIIVATAFVGCVEEVPEEEVPEEIPEEEVPEEEWPPWPEVIPPEEETTIQRIMSTIGNIPVLLCFGPPCGEICPMCPL